MRLFISIVIGTILHCASANGSIKWTDERVTEIEEQMENCFGNEADDIQEFLASKCFHPGITCKGLRKEVTCNSQTIGCTQGCGCHGYSRCEYGFNPTTKAVVTCCAVKSRCSSTPACKSGAKKDHHCIEEQVQGA